MHLKKFISEMNVWGSKEVPFFFVIDFEMAKPMLLKLDELEPASILFDVNGFTNASTPIVRTYEAECLLHREPIAFEVYAQKFSMVSKALSYGDSYLANLTARTKITTNYSLRDLFFLSHARYKLLYNNEFLVFSPEIFVQIREGKVFSYPMKGTIDASIPGAEEKILNDQKELAEHVTIVDLIRNDLSRIADHVTVTRFRYIDELRTNNKNLLQVSSEIMGYLPEDYRDKLGDIMVSLLPAGSVSGAPKIKTLEIIHRAETERRGYYTGVFGYFDGKSIDSGVMIRYIERQGDSLYYRSGGGITTQSVLENEYQEMIDKVYVPLN